MRARPQLILLAMAALIASFIALHRAQDMVLYNGSASMPVGFYRRVERDIGVGAIVTVRAHRVAPGYARQRDAGPRFRLLKHVAATSGDVVCAANNEIRINGEVATRRQTRDSAGRALPTWSGCVTLLSDQLLLLGDSPNSFDSRYFGVVSVDDIEGVWRPLFIIQR